MDKTGEITALKLIIAGLKTEVEQMRKDIDNMRPVLAAVVRASQSNKQLAVSTQVQSIVAASCEDMKKEIFAAINEHMVPAFKSQVQWLNYQTEDTQELLTNYQMEQMCGQGGMKTIASGPNAHLHLGLLE